MSQRFNIGSKRMRDFLRLFINGNRVSVSGELAFATLSDFLRRHLGLTGTKIVCAEGDCGACSVLVGRPSEDSQSFDYRTIDACIVFMHQLDGTHIISVEGLRLPESEKLSVVQDAMVRCHGSQCGFCTPGFVMAMHGLCEENFDSETDAENPNHSPQHLDEDTLRIGLSGNLCRCTGYVQIIQAGKEVDASRVRRMNDLYPPAAMLKERLSETDRSVKIETSDRTLLLPNSLPEASRMKAMHPDARMVTGATDVGVWFNHGRPHAATTIVLSGVDELTRVESTEKEVIVGASVTWTSLMEHFAEPFSEMVQILKRFGSPQIRNIGTIGGNLVNASPIADSIPFLMVIDARLNLISAAQSRSVAINDFYLGYKTIDLRPDELVESIVCPKLKPNQILKLYKVSRRRDMDISTFTAAILLSFDGETISQARIALGGVGPVVLRTPLAEASLCGNPFSLETMRDAGPIARQEISAITDVRGSDVYRQQLTENIFIKCFHDMNSSLNHEMTVQ